MDDLLVEDLANAPPTLWALLIERAGVLARFDGLTKIPASAADAAASELKVSTRYLRKLLVARKLRRDGCAPKHSMTGFGGTIDQAQEEVISAAIEGLGSAARPRDVIQEVIKLCHERGSIPPSSSSIKRRLRDANNYIYMAHTSDPNAGLVVDCCGLELNVFADDGQVGPACLSAQIALPNGYAALAHLAPLQAFATATNTPNCSSALPTSCGRYSEGRLIDAVFGRRLGRIAIRRDVRTWTNSVRMEPVPLEVASGVISHLLERHNSILTSSRR